MNDDAIGRGQKIPSILPGEISKTDPGDGTHAVAVTSAEVTPGEPLRSARYWAVYGAMVAAQVQAYTNTGQDMDDVIMSAVVEEAHATAAWSEEVQP